MTQNPILPESRRPRLRNLLIQNKQVRLIEAHSPLAAKVVSVAASQAPDGVTKTFDGIWVSSLTDSSLAGLPDTEVMGYPLRTQKVFELTRTSPLPFLVDVDTGGDVHTFVDFVHNLEIAGASGCVVEDKIFPKRNSLLEDAEQRLVDCTVFCEKIATSKAQQISSEFMVWARTEALIAKFPMEEALRRAEAYIRAGADGIVVQSVDPTGEEVLHLMKNLQTFTRSWNKPVWFACIPTAYPQISACQLFEAGFHLVIYANHLLRASIRAMEETCRHILEDDRSFDTEKKIASVAELFRLVPQDGAR